MRLEISRRAQADIKSIGTNGIKHFGSQHSEAYVNELFKIFELLKEMPEIARERFEIKAPVRLHPYRGHVILYRTKKSVVRIVRVMSRFQNWADHL